MNSGIYQILNTVNGKVYIGHTIKFSARWAQHRCVLRGNRCANTHLQAAWNKYGEAAFAFSILEQCAPDAPLLVIREQFYMDILRPAYNKHPAGGSNLGIKFGPQAAAQRAAASARMKGKQYALGFVHPPEFGAKISERLRGRIISPEHRAKLSAARKGIPAAPFSALHRLRLSAALIGNKRGAGPHSKAHVAKRVASRQGTMQQIRQECLSWVYGFEASHV